MYVDAYTEMAVCDDSNFKSGQLRIGSVSFSKDPKGRREQNQCRSWGKIWVVWGMPFATLKGEDSGGSGDNAFTPLC